MESRPCACAVERYERTVSRNLKMFEGLKYDYIVREALDNNLMGLDHPLCFVAFGLSERAHWLLEASLNFMIFHAIAQDDQSNHQPSLSTICTAQTV